MHFVRILETWSIVNDLVWLMISVSVVIIGLILIIANKGLFNKVEIKRNRSKLKGNLRFPSKLHIMS
jgi:hypothetical protein